MKNYDRPNFIEKIKAAGGTIILPKPNQILLDIDREHSYNALGRRIDGLNKRTNLNAKIARCVLSHSGWPHAHVTIEVNRDIDDMTRVALSVILGSDPFRGMHDLRRTLNGESDPSLFVEGVNHYDVMNQPRSNRPE